MTDWGRFRHNRLALLGLALVVVLAGSAALAPWLAGRLGEQVNVHLPYWVGAAAVLLGVGVLAVTRRHLTGRTAAEQHELVASKG